MEPNYYLDKEGRFVVENYNLAKPFSGFFPGVAGLYGKPMWVFYVNRAQGISSFGVRDKDGAITEFQSANRAYTLTSTHGFRTFIKLTTGGKTYRYEPFSLDIQHERHCGMAIGSSELLLWERNDTLALDIEVRYFCIPQEPFTSLVREVKIKNRREEEIKLEIIDGLPFILPYGFTERQTKDMSNTIPAWIEVTNLESRVPFYKLKVVVADKPVVTEVTAGNFYIGYNFSGSKFNKIEPIVDPAIVFGTSMDLRLPYQFFTKDEFAVPEKQITSGITPCAFVYLKFGLGQEEKTIYSLVGHLSCISLLNDILKKIKDKEYLPRKLKEARQCVEELQENMHTETSSREFNQYCKNSFLDNVLRGGYPLTVKGKVIHIYGRRHGDLERDYNKFLLQPTYFSQGDGNYRDVCQNRRCDQWFNPDVASDNILTFTNLIQLDGYNPLALKEDRFIIKKIPKELARMAVLLKKPFTLGEVFNFAEQNEIGISRDRLLDLAVGSGAKDISAEFKEGYWIDHWTYILDLLESYKALFPDKFYKLFLEKKYTFYDSSFVVVPLEERIVAANGKIRQVGSVREDCEKAKLINSRADNPNKVRIDNGKGRIYKTTLLVKLLCIVANKAGSLDSRGVGIEMEADKPGWYDALNGLPGLFGSSSCEVFELKRLALLALEALPHLDKRFIEIPMELVKFLKNLKLKEKYREEVKLGLNGKEEKVSVGAVRKILLRLIEKLEKGIEKAYDKKRGVYHTYFINEVLSTRPLRFRQRALPPFLEAQVHALRLMPGKEKASALYKAVRRNGLYDKKLKMYKVNASLKDESLEIGRTKVFSPGWLENESVWLHMEYKYLLELLRNGLYGEFYDDFYNALIPFQEPSVLKRNILENCSFIVSSAHEDNSLHGVGFLPRLTGATAEFIQMWLWMCVGIQPFFVDKENKLNLRFQPLLEGRLFTEDGKFSFKFLGTTLVTYHNPDRKDVFNIKPVKIRFMDIEINGNIIPAPYAEMVRERKVGEIEVYF